MSLSDASRPPVPTTLVTPLPLVAPLCCTPLVFHSGWLSCRLSSHRHLLSVCASASHCTTASHCAPFASLVWLVVTLPLVTPPSPVCLHLCPPKPGYRTGCTHVTTSYGTWVQTVSAPNRRMAPLYVAHGMYDCEKLKSFFHLLLPLKARAPPWCFPPIMQSCISSTASSP